MMENSGDSKSEAFDLLRNVFGSNNSTWTTGCNNSLLNFDSLKMIKESFCGFQTENKLKVLLSISRMPKRYLINYKQVLEEIINDSLNDSEEWVAMLGEMLKTYPSTGSLNTDFSDLSSCANKENRELLVKFMKEAQSDAPEKTNCNYLPLECQYLNKTALEAMVGETAQEQPKHHFNLRKQSKADMLRAELLQKSLEAQLNSKKAAPVPIIPVRVGRFGNSSPSPSPNVPNQSQLKPMVRTPPLRLSPGPVVGSAAPAVLRPLAAKKEGSVKLIEISDQPPIRRKKQSEPTGVVVNKVESASGSNSIPTLRTSSTTPTAVISPIPIIATVFNTTPLMPASEKPLNMIPWTPALVTPPLNPNHGTTEVAGACQIIPRFPPKTYIVTPPTSSTPHVTKVVVERAHQVFKLASNLTNAEKLHIIKFMSGCRENPCPSIGNVIAIELNSEIKQCQQNDGTFIWVSVESQFEMDYGTGVWNVIKKTKKNIDIPITLGANPNMPDLNQVD